MKLKYAIGIDPGKRTGFAVWDIEEKQFKVISTYEIVEAMEAVRTLHHDGYPIQVRFEDCRKRTWFGRAGRERLKGVGSVERDCSIWQEFCELHNIDYLMIHPASTITKMPADKFRRYTKYMGRTSEHSRDAGLLVFGI